MKPPAIFAVIALDAYGEQVYVEIFWSEEGAQKALPRLREDREWSRRATTFHVARFEGRWV